MFPAKTYHYTLKEGIVGHDVWALQINLNDWDYEGFVSEDGNFGENTGIKVEDFQRRRGLVADGIAGPVTQRELGLLLGRRATLEHKLPTGLIRGLAEGESGWFVGAVNWGSPGGVDCGYLQRRIYEGGYTDQAFHDAFSGGIQFDIVGGNLREKKVQFCNYPLVDDRRGWELALLNHNWESAALKYAQGYTNWRYTAVDNSGVKRLYWMTDPADWILNIGLQGVSTGHQWASHYIESKTTYVTSWPK